MTEEWKNHWKDYYKILQVDPSAEPEVIKGAYDRLAKKYHPDVNKETGASERMKLINEAYEILNDQGKRYQYDKVWRQKQANTPPYKTTFNPPRLVAEPNVVLFSNVEPGDIRRASFIVRNVGGRYERCWVSNPHSWLRVTSYKPLTTSGKLPLKISLLAITKTKEWGRIYFENVKIKVDNVQILVRVELRTKAISEYEKPITETYRRPNTTTHSPPRPQNETHPRKMSEDAIGCIILIAITIVIIILVNVVKC